MNEFSAPGFPEAFPEAILIVDQGGIIRFVNRCTETLLGSDRGELIGCGVDSLVPERLRRGQNLDRFHSSRRSRPSGGTNQSSFQRRANASSRVQFATQGWKCRALCREWGSLRVLEEGTFERIGSSRTTKVNVRIVAATKTDLAEAVREGRFRQDLYYRLNVFPIEVPPLRQRPEDIPLLVWSFIEEFSREMGITIESVSIKSMERLQRHPWPGNVRELRNVVERSMIFCRGPDLHLTTPAVDQGIGQVALTLDEVQRRHILEVLKMVGGRISGQGGAAKILGIKPTTLRSRMERLGLDPRGREN